MTSPQMRRRAVLAATAAAATAVGAIWVGLPSGQAAPAKRQVTREQVARSMLDHGRARFGTASMQRALLAAAGELPSGAAARERDGGKGTASARTAGGGSPAGRRADVANVRVNDPSLDRTFVDQTTQNETSLAVSGSRVAVGFNDTQHATLFLTAGVNLNGYAYSSNGGRSFRDGGVVPNRPGYVNLGDPWLASERSGRMYYSSLVLDGRSYNGEIGTATSGDGGRTWTPPTIVSQNDPAAFYIADKDAMTVGRGPASAGQDNAYVAWDDFSYDFATDSEAAGLAVSTSSDGGRTWSVHYADQIQNTFDSCSFGQFIGAQPLVDASNGALYVAAERIAVDDPLCEGGTVTFSQVFYTSTDGGQTFSPAVKVADVTPAFDAGAMQLGPGELVRTIEFPVLAEYGGALWMAWNDGEGGHSHIKLARSGDGGTTWSTSAITSGSGDEIQPALAADGGGLHVAYYQRNADDTLDVVLADSRNGSAFDARTVTSRSFPGVLTAPPFDPVVGYAYMGDYIANVSAGGHSYLAWGDNRNIVRNTLWEQGRHDPDVYFARR